jgi:hypothetical protein
MHGIKGRTSENSAYRLRNLWSKTMKLANKTSPLFIFVKLKACVVIITSMTRPGNSSKHIGHRISIRYVESFVVSVRPSAIPASKLGPTRKFVAFKRPK